MITIKKSALSVLLMLLFFALIPVSGISGLLVKSGIPLSSTSDEAIQLFVQGREAFEMGRVADASRLMERALQKDANFALAWLYKAYMSDSDAGWRANMDKAISHRNTASEEERILINYEEARNGGNSEKCFELAERLAKMQPRDARALLLLAAEYHDRGQVNKFRELAMDAIRFDPESPLGFRALGASWVFHEPRDFNMAYKYLQEYTDLRPGEASAHLALGDVLRINLSLNDARKCLDEAIRLDSGLSEAYAKRGYVNTYLGRLPEARQDFRSAASLHVKTSGNIRNNNSLMAYLMAGRPFASDPVTVNLPATKSKRIPMTGNSDNCYFCCTFISMINGFYIRPDTGIKECVSIAGIFDRESVPPDELAIEEDFAFVDIYRTLISQDFVSAEQKISNLEQKYLSGNSSGKVEACNYLSGLLYSAKNEHNKALSYFKKSDTGNLCVKYNMALAYNKLGRIEEAEKLFAEIAGCKTFDSDKTAMVKISDNWLKSLALAREKNE